MNYLFIGNITQNLRNTITRTPRNGASFIGIVIHQSPGNLSTTQIDARHHFTPAKLTSHRLHTNWQKTSATLAQNLYGTVVQRQGAASLQMTGNPLFA